MPSRDPTPAQRPVLTLLTEFTELTTREIREWLGVTTSRRATERLLQRMQARGYIGAAPLQPHLGAASPRVWSLLRPGAAALGVPYVPAPKAARLSIAPSHATLLRLLGEMRQLTTRQIARYLHPDKPKWYTEQLLRGLRMRGYILDARLHPERGAASEHYWRLCAKGARAVDGSYGKQHRRVPSPDTLRYRGLQLDLMSQVIGAGWSLLRPSPIRRGQCRDTETAQRRQLVAAVLAVERHAIRNLLMLGVAPQALQDRIARAQAGQVGAVVPAGVNDYVAYMPGHPELTVVLILHPPMAGRAFWTRRPQYPSRASDRRQRESRVERYRRLAQVLPVLAVFASAEVANSLAYVFEPSGIQPVVVTDIRERLTELALRRKAPPDARSGQE